MLQVNAGFGLATRRSGVATGQTPKQVKRRASGISVLEQKNIDKRHDRYSGKDPDDENVQQNNMRQDMRVGKSNNPKPGEVYTVIENGVTVRKTYPLNPTVEQVSEPTPESKSKSKVQTDAQKYANLTPWFRAKLLGEKIPVSSKKSSSVDQKVTPVTHVKKVVKEQGKLSKPASQKDGDAKK
tara:strand:+ start:542 stop:1090 length:549 start_codon:yes stop_codon:yes gene_type:complete